MTRNSCLSSKFLFCSAIFSWLIFRSVTSRTIYSQSRITNALRDGHELRYLRNKRSIYGSCDEETVSVLSTRIREYGTALFLLVEEGRIKKEERFKVCRIPGTPCGDPTSLPEGRRYTCQQVHKIIEIETRPLFNEAPKILVFKMPSGCDCLEEIIY